MPRAKFPANPLKTVDAHKEQRNRHTDRQTDRHAPLGFIPLKKAFGKVLYRTPLLMPKRQFCVEHRKKRDVQKAWLAAEIN